MSEQSEHTLQSVTQTYAEVLLQQMILIFVMKNPMLLLIITVN